MIKRIFAAALLAAVLLPAAALAQTAYCSAPAGYSGATCFGSVCEYTTDALYGGYIGPSLEVSSTGQNCTPLSSWPYYSLTLQPGTTPSTAQLGDPPAADPPSVAPEISANDALGGLTLMLGLALVGRGRRLTQ